MSIVKTLGGDRVGSGKKMKVEMHGYERSTHDLGYLWRSTMSPGTLVPFMCKVALPGDTWDIDLNANIMTHPTIGPLFGSYKVQLDVFQAPIRLYNALLHNNAIGIGMNINQVKFPVIKLKPTVVAGSKDIDNSQINPSSLLSYLGIRGVGVPASAGLTPNREFNAIPILAYWEIYKQYYANKQEEIGAVIHTTLAAVEENITEISLFYNGNQFYIPEAPAEDLAAVEAGQALNLAYSGSTKPVLNNIIFSTTNHGDLTLEQLADFGSEFTPGQQVYYIKGQWGNIGIVNWRYRGINDISIEPPKVVTFPLSNIDGMREDILMNPSKTSAYDISTYPPYSYLAEQPFGRPNLLSSQEGLAIKTYQSDLFNNWLQTEWIDGTNGISAMSAIDVSDGTLTMDALNLAKKVYEMLTRIAVSGGTYDNWLEVQYDHDNITRAESPIYEGGLSKELVFQEVVSNAAADGEALGTLAGKGVMSKKHKGGQMIIRVNEPSYIIGIISLTPRVDYSQGNNWDVHLKTMADLHVPALDQIGFQESLVEERAWWDTTYDNTGLTPKWIQRSAGKVPAWINYMTSVNEVRGNFAIADNEMFMTLNRRFEADDNGIVKDLTTYIDPVKFNFIFADSALDAQNFWAQVSIDATVRRKMSAKIMPNI